MKLKTWQWWLLGAAGVVGLLAAAVILYAWSLPGVELADLLFFFIAAVVVGCAAFATLASNIVRAVFALLGTFFGVAGLYAMLSADFLAVVQVMVYVGGVLVLMLFAVMLTSRIELAGRSNRSGGLLGLIGAGLVVSVVLAMLIGVALRTPWPTAAPGEYTSSVEPLGDALLGQALLPFELLGVLLLAVVVGAVVIARLPKEERP